MANRAVDSPRESSEEEGLPFLGHTPAHEKTKPWVIMVILAFALVAIIDMGAFLAEAPRTRVYESNICLGYYQEFNPSVIGADGTIPEKLCKVDEVQQKMAMIFGWQEMFDAIPSIFLAIPFGVLADKVGRKWIFTASLMGLQLNSAWVLGICGSNNKLAACYLSLTLPRLFQKLATPAHMVVFGVLLYWWRAHRRSSDRHHNDLRHRTT